MREGEHQRNSAETISRVEYFYIIILYIIIFTGHYAQRDSICQIKADLASKETGNYWVTVRPSSSAFSAATAEVMLFALIIFPHKVS